MNTPARVGYAVNVPPLSTAAECAIPDDCELDRNADVNPLAAASSRTAIRTIVCPEDTGHSTLSSTASGSPRSNSGCGPASPRPPTFHHACGEPGRPSDP